VAALAGAAGGGVLSTGIGGHGVQDVRMDSDQKAVSRRRR